MAINTQFSIAVHLMAGLGCQPEQHITSAKLATSVNTSPSFVRRVVAKLSKAGLVRTATGKSGACWLARKPEKISLLDIYRAVDAPKAFAIHEYQEMGGCPVSCRIKSALESALKQTQSAMEAGLKRISLRQIIRDLE